MLKILRELTRNERRYESFAVSDRYILAWSSWIWAPVNDKRTTSFPEPITDRKFHG